MTDFLPTIRAECCLKGVGNDETPTMRIHIGVRLRLAACYPVFRRPGSGSQAEKAELLSLILKIKPVKDDN